MDVLLAIEVAHSSSRFDTSTKAALYARLGVRDYWVVNAESLTARVHRQPSSTAYASVIEVPPSEVLVPLLAPPLAVKLADLVID